MSNNWGYYQTSWGKKILAKKFDFEGTTVFYFTIYRLERMIDDSWAGSDYGSDAFILAEILEAYLTGDVCIGWAEGFPMAYPFIDDYDLDFDLDDF